MLIISCAKDKSDDIPEQETAIPIEFSSAISMTKGLDELNYERIIDKRFGLFAYLKDDRAYLENRDVEYVSSSGKTNYWRCSPAAYWPFQESLSFFAYAPYDENMQIEDYNGGMPRIRFTPTTDVTFQPDFCVAVPRFDRLPSDGAIQLTFHHTLTRIRLYVNIKGYEAPSYDYYITDLKIRGVDGSRTLTFRDNEEKPYQWDGTDPASPKTGSYHLTSSRSQLTNETVKFVNNLPAGTEGLDRYTYANAMVNGRLYLLPQTLTSDAEIEAVISVHKEITGELISILPPFTFKLPVGSKWEEEKTVSYLMTINIENAKESVIEPVISDWTDSDNTHNKEIIE